LSRDTFNIIVRRINVKVNVDWKCSETFVHWSKCNYSWPPYRILQTRYLREGSSQTKPNYICIRHVLSLFSRQVIIRL